MPRPIDSGGSDELDVDVQVDYAGLGLTARKGVTARRELLLGGDGVLLQTPALSRAVVAREIEAVLATIVMPVHTTDSEPLDAFVRRILERAEQASGTKNWAASSVDCGRCTGRTDDTCDGTASDAGRIDRGGSCVDALRRVCDLAIRTMRTLYARVLLPSRHAGRITIGFVVGPDCPEDAAAAYCVGGESAYEDAPASPSCRVTLALGLPHWRLDSYAALAVVLSHELICHAGHAVTSGGVRRSTSARDGFVEGWMDLVARRALVATCMAARDVPGELAYQIERAANVISAWRLANTSSGGCRPRRWDMAAIDRRCGERQAAAAYRLFGNDGGDGGFLAFSAAFNAASGPPRLREDLMEDVAAVSSQLNPPHDHPLLEAIELFKARGDLSLFMERWRRDGHAAR